MGAGSFPESRRLALESPNLSGSAGVCRARVQICAGGRALANLFFWTLEVKQIPAETSPGLLLPAVSSPCLLRERTRLPSRHKERASGARLCALSVTAQRRLASE